jgi:lipoprotein-anchoring transpeptidase ErfK/SrfK
MSHGCINLPLNSAAWLYGWAPPGTPVQVTY